MRTVRALGVGLAAVLLAGGLGAGCGKDPEQAAADERMCTAKDRLGEALRNFTQTEEETRSEDLAAARDELMDALAEMAHASSDVAQAEGGEAEAPIQQLNQDLQDIEDDATLTEVAQGMAVAAGGFLENVKEFLDNRDC